MVERWCRGSCTSVVSIFHRRKDLDGHWFVEVLGHLWRTKNGAKRENVGGCAVFESPKMIFPGFVLGTLMKFLARKGVKTQEMRTKWQTLGNV
jgi:hypothetical protein